MRTNEISALLIFCTIVSAVPSIYALHPERATLGLREDDVSGSGFEIPGKQRNQGMQRPRVGLSELAALWREMAGNVRRQARLMDEDRRAEFLARAERYEQRAAELEKGLDVGS